MHLVHIGLAPSYLRECVTASADVTSRPRLRSTSSQRYERPRTRLKYGDRSFSSARPRAWNSLPSSLQELTDSTPKLSVTVVYHWTLGLVMREQNTKLITLITNLKSWIQSLPQTDALISSARYVGLAGSGLGGGGSKPTPQTKIFSHQCRGHLQPVGVKPPTPRQIERWLGHSYRYGIKNTQTFCPCSPNLCRGLKSAKFGLCSARFQNPEQGVLV